MKNGEHESRCIDYAMGFDKNGGQRLELLFENADGEKGNVLLSFSGRAVEWPLKKMRALGWEQGLVLDSLKTNAVIVRAYEEEYQGKAQKRHDIQLPEFGGIMTKPKDRMNEGAAQKFLRQFGGGESEQSYREPPADPHSDPNPNGDGW